MWGSRVSRGRNRRQSPQIILTGLAPNRFWTCTFLKKSREISRLAEIVGAPSQESSDKPDRRENNIGVDSRDCKSDLGSLSSAIFWIELDTALVLPQCRATRQGTCNRCSANCLMVKMHELSAQFEVCRKTLLEAVVELQGLLSINFA